MPRGIIMGHEDMHKQTKKAAVNALGTVIAGCAIGAGIGMLIIGNKFGDQCKMDAIDATTKDNPAEKGNLPKWYIYTGSFFIVSGIAACCTVGFVPLYIRSWSLVAGGALADILTGLFGRLTLLVMFGIATLCNVLGTFWLYLAGLVRNGENSTEVDDPNYCQPIVWNTAHFITKAYWVITLVSFVAIGAQIHKFFHRPSDDFDITTVEGGSGKMKLPKKRHHGRR